MVEANLAIDSARSIVLAMDFQPMVLRGVGNADELVATVAGAVASARKAGLRIGYVRVAFDDADYGQISQRNKAFAALAANVGYMHANSPDTAIHPDLAPQDDDIVVRKTRFGALSTTDLVRQLEDAQIDTIILAGVSTSGVVLSTVRDAADRDLRVVVLSDGCADPDDEAHRVLVTKVFPVQADVITVAELQDAIG
ncbi:cysteine hydrolase family protein [Amycolatopsis sp. GM8]|uniref:cysteine hydrolase family protein n=1 Tax=Amycolatopsis sp. GM8 TaxID=2896530 RepID=UPI001F3690A3|nr:cysteine hydrolase [Amycolatopsis sp. GM8]